MAAPCVAASLLGLLVASLLGPTAVAAFDMKDFANIAEEVGDFFGQTEHCSYQCPHDEPKRPNPAHRPTSNGCGSYGFQLDVSYIPHMTDCCNVHDFCYDACGQTKPDCDRELRRCLKNVCDSRHVVANKKEECHTLSQLIFGGAATLGCDAYKSSQAKACLCVSPSNKRNSGYEKRNHGDFGSYYDRYKKWF